MHMTWITCVTEEHIGVHSSDMRVGTIERDNNTDSSSVTAKLERVVFPPGSTNRGVVVTAALAQSTILLSNAGKTTSLAALVDGVDDPVDSGVAANL